MSRARNVIMGQSLSYQGYLAKYIWYFIRCPTKGRPKDCIHPCPRYLHSGACEPCTQFVELECYCEATGIVKPCKEWCDMADEQKQLVKCCRVRCAKIMECGHQCPRICHPSRCADPKECVENVVRYCNCERIERVFPCRGCGAKDQEVQCDHICAQLLKTYKQAIAEMKNNPVRLTEDLKESEDKGSDSDKIDLCTEGTSIDEANFTTTELSSTIDAKQESGSESGFNEDKTECDDTTEAHAEDAAEKETVEAQSEAHAQADLDTEAVEPEIVSAERQSIVDTTSLADSYEPDVCESPHSEASCRRSLQRASRPSSRISNYSEEDIPHQLDQDRIVKIMRSSTRRKKLIKCGPDIINEMQTS